MIGRLSRDNAGNTLAIAAASLIPMMALIGGGVDMSRSYMAKTELQSACDAGVLAGRKAMSKSGVYGTAEEAKAESMFNFNFNGGALNVSDVSFETEDNEGGQVLGTATARVPTLMMKIFDKDNVDLAVNCMAELQIGNADIMFVLDVTGSMNSAIKSGEDPKIDGLRAAVFDFHKTVNQAVVDNRTRIRYGFVPYSQTVNVGGLVNSGAMPVDYLVDENSYQTRYATFSTPVVIANSPTTDNDTEWLTNSNGTKQLISSSNCTGSSGYGVNKYPNSNGVNPVTTGTAPNDVVTITYSNGGRGTESGTNKSCYRKRKIVTQTYTTWYEFKNWTYGKINDVDVSTFKAGTPYRLATGVTLSASATPGASARVRTAGTYNMLQLGEMVTNGQTYNVSSSTAGWSGCIEERSTESPKTSYDFDPIPDDAYDMDLELEPSDWDTSWRPQWGALEYDRTYTNYYYKYSSGSDRGWYVNPNYSSGSKLDGSPPGAEGNTCPSEMMLFRSVELTDGADDVPSWLTTYINGLVAVGSTYHDLGMIWGGRLTASEGIFADNVNLDADKINVSKHIIFMTDGKMEPSTTAYSAYGLEKWDHRIAPSGYESTITARHHARFSAVCEAIKAQGVTIWVVAFGTSMTTQLQNCASSGRSYYSSDTTALRSTFKFIAAQVADLRLGA